MRGWLRWSIVFSWTGSGVCKKPLEVIRQSRPELKPGLWEWGRVIPVLTET